MKQNNPLRRYSLLSLTLASVSGCTPYSESFDCPPGRGVGCKSLNVINQMVEEGKLPLEGSPLEGDGVLENNSHTIELIEASHSPSSQVPHSRALSRDTHLKVWMAAYEDEGGVFHTSATIYVPLKNGPPLMEKKPSRVNNS